MKILLATDGSAWSAAAVREVARRPWPAGTAVRIVAAVDIAFRGAPSLGPVSGEYFGVMEKTLSDLADGSLLEARDLLTHREGGALDVSEMRLVGPPAAAILEEAEAWGADLIVLGSHGRGIVGRFFLGSVSHAVLLHAKCSVEIVRKRSAEEP